MKRELIGVLVLLSLLTCGARAGLDSGVVEPPEVLRADAAGGDGASAFNYGVAAVRTPAPSACSPPRARA